MDKSNPYQPVRIRSVLASEQIYEHIKEAIISGELTSEERLIETKLAEWLQVSRTPLREALQRLEVEKWVTRLQGGGLKVMEFEEGKIKHLFNVRAVLEGLLAREVTMTLTDQELETIKVLTTEMHKCVQAQDNEKIIQSAEKIHQLLLDKSTNTIAKDMLSFIHDQIRYCKNRVIRWVQDLPEAYEEHLELNEALFKRDPIEVEKAMRRHFENGAYRLLRNLEK